MSIINYEDLGAVIKTAMEAICVEINQFIFGLCVCACARVRMGVVCMRAYMCACVIN